MKTIITACVALFVCGFAYGQDTSSNYEHLKCYEQLVGTWVYEGPTKEPVEGVAEKGDPILLRHNFGWILDKNGLEATFYAEVRNEGGFKVSAKSLIAFDTGKDQIVSAGLNSIGGLGLASTKYDADTKTWTTDSKGVDGDGVSVSDIGVIRMKDDDTIVMQNLDRKGPLFQGDSPEYTFKRVKRPKQSQRLKQAK